MTVATREFQVFAKPAGAACNLACRYCYYLPKAALYPGDAPARMADDLLERYIAEHISACPTPSVLFSWHGGEPTILGLDYFRRIVVLQRAHCPPGRRIVNGIQTNGTLLDDDWCRFLKAEGFLVGLSIDGPADLHDAFRRTRGQAPTHARVMDTVRLLRQHRIPFDTLCVVHSGNVGQPQRVYAFFREMGADYIQFLPLVACDASGQVTPESVPSAAYGKFLSAVFRLWLAQDMHRIGVQNIEEAARPLLGLEHAMCHFRETCGDAPALERNGDYYVCDHFVDAAHRVGNLRETPLLEMLESEQQRAFGRAKRESLPRYCRLCHYRAMCHGGCPKDRFLTAPGGEPGLNYLCEGYRLFFGECLPALQALAARRKPGQRVVRLMDLAPMAPVVATGRVGRNDPCPCGSGRKYKDCCLRLGK